jgi:hypothetical protein
MAIEEFGQSGCIGDRLGHVKCLYGRVDRGRTCGNAADVACVVAVVPEA